jgi:hypothetical protein
MPGIEFAPPTYFGNLPQVQNPQSENFLQTAQGAQQLNLMRQQQQSQALSIQEQQMQLASQQGMMQAWHAAAGDPTKMAQIAPQYNVLPKDIMAMNTTLMGMAKTRAETDKDTLAADDAKNDILHAAYQPAFAEKDPAKQAALVSSINQNLLSRYPNLRPTDLIQYTGPQDLVDADHAYTTRGWISAKAAEMRGQAAATQAQTTATKENAELPLQQAGAEQAQRANIAAKLGEAADAATYDQIRDQSGMAAQFPPSRLVFDPTGKAWLPGQQTAVQRVGMTVQARTQADQAAANAAQNALPKTEPELSLIVNDPSKPQALRDAAKGALQTMVQQHNAERPVVNITPTIPGLGVPPQGSQAKATGEEYLSTLPVGTAAQVRAIAEGRSAMPQPSRFARPGAPLSPSDQLRGAVFQYDPGYSDQKAQIRKGLTTGSEGKNIGALNTATVHLDQLSDAAAALNTGDVQVVNRAMNTLKTAFGAAAPTNFDALKNAVAGEMASALKGNATDPEIANASRSIQAANSPGQLAGVVDTNLHVLGAKLNTYQQRYRQQIPEDQIWSPILPAARGVFQKHGFDPTAAPVQAAGGVTVAAPDGSKHTFPDQAHADAFKKAAGIQ